MGRTRDEQREGAKGDKSRGAGAPRSKGRRVRKLAHGAQTADAMKSLATARRLHIGTDQAHGGGADGAKSGSSTGKEGGRGSSPDDPSVSMGPEAEAERRDASDAAADGAKGDGTGSPAAKPADGVRPKGAASAAQDAGAVPTDAGADLAGRKGGGGGGAQAAGGSSGGGGVGSAVADAHQGQGGASIQETGVVDEGASRRLPDQLTLHSVWGKSSLGKGSGDYGKYGEAGSKPRSDAALQALGEGGVAALENINGTVVSNLGGLVEHVPGAGLVLGGGDTALGALTYDYAGAKDRLNYLAGDLTDDIEDSPWGVLAEGFHSASDVIDAIGVATPVISALIDTATVGASVPATTALSVALQAAHVQAMGSAAGCRLMHVVFSDLDAKGVDAALDDLKEELAAVPPTSGIGNLANRLRSPLVTGDEWTDRAADFLSDKIYGKTEKLLDAGPGPHARVARWESAEKKRVRLGDPTAPENHLDNALAGRFTVPVASPLGTGLAAPFGPAGGSGVGPLLGIGPPKSDGRLRDLPTPPHTGQELSEAQARHQSLLGQLHLLQNGRIKEAHQARQAAAVMGSTVKRSQQLADGAAAAVAEQDDDLKAQFRKTLEAANTQAELMAKTARLQEFAQTIESKKKEMIKAIQGLIAKVSAPASSEGGEEEQEPDQSAEEAAALKSALAKASALPSTDALNKIAADISARAGDVAKEKGELDKAQGKADQAGAKVEADQAAANDDMAKVVTAEEAAAAQAAGAEADRAQVKSEADAARAENDAQQEAMAGWATAHAAVADRNDDVARSLLSGEPEQGAGILTDAQRASVDKARNTVEHTLAWLTHVEQRGRLRNSQGLSGARNEQNKAFIQGHERAQLERMRGQLDTVTGQNYADIVPLVFDTVGRVRKRLQACAPPPDGPASDSGPSTDTPTPEPVPGATPTPEGEARPEVPGPAKALFDHDQPKPGGDVEPVVGQAFYDIASYLGQAEGAKVTLRAHASVPGNRGYNHRLAGRRAAVVKRMLLRNAVAQAVTQISVDPVGEGDKSDPDSANGAKAAGKGEYSDAAWRRVDVSVRGPAPEGE